MMRFYSLLRPELTGFMIQPVRLVFTHPDIDGRLWTLRSLHGQLKYFRDRAFSFYNYSTILVHRDLFAFRASDEEDMVVIKL